MRLSNYALGQVHCVAAKKWQFCAQKNEKNEKIWQIFNDLFKILYASNQSKFIWNWQ